MERHDFLPDASSGCVDSEAMLFATISHTVIGEARCLSRTSRCLLLVMLRMMSIFPSLT